FGIVNFSDLFLKSGIINFCCWLIFCSLLFVASLKAIDGHGEAMDLSVAKRHL
ncbi:hypothetical protein glysoja_026596, partial [Glycine soja]